MDKPFLKTPERIVIVTIDEDGQMTYIATDSADVFMDLGTTITRRASHVEPATFWPRVAFHILRWFVTDKSRVAAWTRIWGCNWRINTAPLGGPILTWGDVWGSRGDCQVWMRQMPMYHAVACWSNRQKAIDAEIIFLNSWFAERWTKIR